MAESFSQHYDDIEHPSLNGSSAGDLSNRSGDSSPGRPSMESYLERKKPAMMDDSSSQHYRDRCSRLEGELHDADRKIRQQVDEIMQLKRELSKDRTETLLTHQKELSDLKESHNASIDRLKESHRRELKDFEKQLNEFEKQAFRMELEQKTGGRDGMSRVLDLLEENAPMFVGVLTQIMSGQANSGLAQPQPGQPDLNPPGGDLSEEDAKAITDALKTDIANGQGQPQQKIQNSANEDDPIKPGEGDTQIPLAGHPSGFEENPNPGGLNNFFSGKQNGHPEPRQEI
ncbi:MAG: hypothetical protein WD449_00800 [Candidatus Babeliales bacterium]